MQDANEPSEEKPYVELWHREPADFKIKELHSKRNRIRTFLFIFHKGLLHVLPIISSRSTKIVKYSKRFIAL